MSGQSLEDGSAACTRTLSRLLERVERAIFKSPPQETPLKARVHQFPVTKSSVPEYFALPNYAARQSYHARARNACAAGAITLEWDKAAGVDGQLSRIIVVDAIKLATDVGRQPAWMIAAAAIAQLQAWRSRVSGVGQFIERWSAGRPLRGKTPEQLRDVLDGCTVMAWLAEQGDSDEILVRRLSIQLFGDSKRIERITAVLDQLSGGTEEEGGVADILERLGLVKHPQPLLLAGDMDIVVTTTRRRCDFPYSGLAPDFVVGIGSKFERGVLLSIENLATFNQLSRDTKRPQHVALIYTAGMPTPAFLAAYRRIISTLPNEWSIRHWGDIDLGGFRIAYCLFKAAGHEGRRLQSWNMDALPIDPTPESRVMDNSEIRRIQALCELMSWTQVGQTFAALSYAIEQEGQRYEWNRLFEA